MSKILSSIHGDVAQLHDLGLIDSVTMRKFHYLVTIDMDGDHLEQMIKEQPDLIDCETFGGVTPENFVGVFAGECK